MSRRLIFLFSTCYLILPNLFAQENAKIDSLENRLVGANKSDSIEILIHLGDEYYNQENFSKALDIFFTGLRVSESIGNATRAADAANDIGRIYYEIENLQEALSYYSKALDYFIEVNNEAKLGGVYNNIALVLYEMDSVNQAVEYYNKALEMYKKYDLELELATIYHNLGLVYINTKEYESAVKNLESSREIFIELGYNKYAANSTNNIGRALYKSEKYQEALKYFEQGLEEAKKEHSAFLIMDNFKYQSDCYAQLGKFNEAYWYANEYYILKDSLLNIDKEKELAEIQAKYEDEIREQENKLLKKENEAKTATIKLQYFIGIAIFVVSILAGVLAIIYYRSDQNKKKTNLQLKKQKDEIEEKNVDLSKLNEEITIQNEAINEQKKELEELNTIKDKLFSIISHEFRSPLNSLKGTLALLKVGALSDEELNAISKELTDKINSTSIFLDNLLNWAKSQMQGINPKPITLDVWEMTDENIKLLKSMGDKKKVRIENNIPEKSMVHVDPNMLNLIFRNLISNAIKFSLRGGIIQINSEIEGEQLKISVSDSGIGMAEENIKMLFQVQSFTTRGTANERGTGLGLYISKNFIESNGGSIWVESEEGKGSIFNFTVPIAK